MKILYAAELVGKAGVFAFKKGLARLPAHDFTVVNADGATGGNGLGRNHAGYIRKLGADALTLGDCCFFKKDLTENISEFPYVIRPENISAASPGRGYGVFRVKKESRASNLKVAVLSLVGQANFSRFHGESPFTRIQGLLRRLREETPLVIVDFHAEATAEKETLFALAAGRCTAVIGSHTRVATADERIVDGPEGGRTAVICDAGRSGSQISVGGCESESRIQEFLTGIPDWTREAADRCELCGVIIEADEESGDALAIERFQVPVDYKIQEERKDKAQKDTHGS